MVWYFAYGSNLDMNQMKERVGSLGRCRRAVLRGWRLVFNVSSTRWRGKAANIIQTGNPEDIVYGALYQISEMQLEKLTQREGPHPQKLEVESQQNRIDAQVYVFNPRGSPGKPTEQYVDRILSGLRQHGYDQIVIDSVRKTAHESA